MILPPPQHPCFGGNREKFGRIHLPVAPRCNIQCAFCDRRFDCVNESRPGVTSAVLSPHEALERTSQILRQDPRIRVAGIAGPGDPFANPETFETLSMLRRAFPHLILCASTNGLLVEKHFQELLDLRLDTITVTINAFSPETAEKIYTAVHYDGQTLSTKEGCQLLLQQQQNAVRLCVGAGIPVKVNTVLIPGINQDEIGEIARFAAQSGAILMNVVPLIPCGAMARTAAPTAEQLKCARKAAGQWIQQFTHCQQCRADACGLL